MSDNLQHYGIKGMKWGVRRFQPYPKGKRAKAKGGKKGKEVGKAKSKRQIRKENRAAIKKKNNPTGISTRQLTKERKRIAKEEHKKAKKDIEKGINKELQDLAKFAEENGLDQDDGGGGNNPEASKEFDRRYRDLESRTYDMERTVNRRTSKRLIEEYGDTAVKRINDSNRRKQMAVLAAPLAMSVGTAALLTLTQSSLDDDVLQHYGVKGMKWGVRRYQKKDGSRKAAGKKRAKKNRKKRKRSTATNAAITAAIGIPMTAANTATFGLVGQKLLDSTIGQPMLGRTLGAAVGYFGSINATGDLFNMLNKSNRSNKSKDDLKHYGVKGMKWGVRRYQPYPKGQRNAGKFLDVDKQKSNQNGNKSNKVTKDSGVVSNVKATVRSKGREISMGRAQREIKNLSTKDAKKVASRSQLENRMKRLSSTRNVGDTQSKRDYLNRESMSNQELRRKVDRLQLADNMRQEARKANKGAIDKGKKVAAIAAPLAVQVAVNGAIDKKWLKDKMPADLTSFNTAKNWDSIGKQAAEAIDKLL